MSPSQRQLYWRSWSQCRKTLLEKGWATDTNVDEMRHKLHIRALGNDKSSTAFTNADIDNVLAQFWAITLPDDLQTQLRQQDQPFLRWYWECARILSDTQGIITAHLDAYLKGLAKRMFGNPYLDTLSGAERKSIIAAIAIHHIRHHAKRRSHKAAA